MQGDKNHGAEKEGPEAEKQTSNFCVPAGAEKQSWMREGREAYREKVRTVDQLEF